MHDVIAHGPIPRAISARSAGFWWPGHAAASRLWRYVFVQMLDDYTSVLGPGSQGRYSPRRGSAEVRGQCRRLGGQLLFRAGRR